MSPETLKMFNEMGLLEDPKYRLLADAYKKQMEIVDEMKILYIQVIKQEQNQEEYVEFLVKVVTSENDGKRIAEVIIDGKDYQTFKKNDFYERNSFFAKVSVDFSSVSVMFEQQTIKLTANLKDIVSNEITDTKSINVKVNRDGSVGETDEKIEEDNIDIVGCGLEFRDKIKCSKYGLKYGPVYFGSIKMSDYKNWDDLISQNKITYEEKEIIIAMSENEGNLDAINGYDDQIVSVGAMQKTVNQEGTGELPIQIWEFSLAFPKKYQSIMVNCGWRVEEETSEDENGKEIVEYRIYYNDISKKDLYKKIRKGFSKENYGKKVQSIPLEPLIKLSKDTDFQSKQIEDFIERLHQSIQKKPSGYLNRISEFIKSNLGKATVLDHDINRPGHVRMYFGEALDRFFAANPYISKNVSEWGENHDKNEKKFLEIYGPLRGKKIGKVKHPMTDASLRYSNLKSKL